MRKTFSAWRSMSSAPMYTWHSKPNRAQTVAVATPCCPAPVSATIRRLPSRRASTAWPSALLSLWAPVWRRSSRLRYRRLLGAKRSASVSGVNRPRLHGADRRAHVVRPEPAGEYEAILPARVAPVVGILLLPRQVGDARDLFA